MTEPTTAVLLRRLPPAICGVGDFTWNLWKHMGDPLPAWKFLVLEGANETANLEGAPPVNTVHASPGSVASAIGDARTLILQYTPYAFDPSGAPVWLADGIERWKSDDRRLVAMFHEGFAVSPPWKRSFWKAGAQKKTIRRLGAMADVCLTTTDWFRGKLKEVDVEARLCPVPSNIPQAERNPHEGETLRIAVFGQPQSRRKALRRHQGLLLALMKAGRMDELVIIGEASPEAEATFVPLQKIAHKGVLEPGVVAETLAGCDVLLCAHPPEEMRKSGATAAALSNACAVVVRGDRREDNPPGVFYNEPDLAAEALTRETIEKLSASGREWYEDNASWEACVKVWRDAM